MLLNTTCDLKIRDFPGKHYLDQLDHILGVLGSLTPSDLQTTLKDKTGSYLASLPYKPQIPFSKIYPTADLQAIDLLERMLTFNLKPSHLNRILNDKSRSYLASLQLQSSKQRSRSVPSRAPSSIPASIPSSVPSKTPSKVQSSVPAPPTTKLC